MALHTPSFPAVAAMPGDMKDALPALTVMMVNGAWNFLIAILTLIAGWLVARWVGRWVQELIGRSHYVDDTLKPLIANFAGYVILAVTVVAVLSQFGVQTTSLIALLGAAGLAVGLALQGTLSNVASGVLLLILRPFRVYEKIKVADALGTVREIGLFRTDIVTDDGTYVSIPNTTIFSGAIVNVSRESRRRTNFTVEWPGVGMPAGGEGAYWGVRGAGGGEAGAWAEPGGGGAAPAPPPAATAGRGRIWGLPPACRDAEGGGSGRPPRQINAPVPVAPPAVAPWTPPAELARESKKPN